MTYKNYFLVYLKKYFSIRIISCSNIFHKNLKINKDIDIKRSILYKPDSFQDLKKKINIIKPDYVVLGGSDLFKNKIYNLLDINRVKIIDFYIHYPEFHKISFNLILRTILDLKIFIFFSEFLKIFITKFKYFFTKHRNKKNPILFDLIFFSGYLAKNYILKKKIFKNIISLNSFEYSLPLRKLKKRKFAVFLDNLTFGHPDRSIIDIKELEANNYYFEMNKFFNFLKFFFKLDIIIAAHPKTDLKKFKKYYENNEVIINKTHDLIFSSEFVMAHSTTSAINFAVIYKKPIIFITSNDINRDFYYYKMLLFKNSILKQPLINISKPNNFLKFKKYNTINSIGYNEFTSKYLKAQDASLLDPKREIVNNILKL